VNLDNYITKVAVITEANVKELRSLMEVPKGVRINLNPPLSGKVLHKGKNRIELGPHSRNMELVEAVPYTSVGGPNYNIKTKEARVHKSRDVGALATQLGFGTGLGASDTYAYGRKITSLAGVMGGAVAGSIVGNVSAIKDIRKGKSIGKSLVRGGLKGVAVGLGLAGVGIGAGMLEYTRASNRGIDAVKQMRTITEKQRKEALDTAYRYKKYGISSLGGMSALRKTKYKGKFYEGTYGGYSPVK
jgi:hypothetical protein